MRPLEHKRVALLESRKAQDLAKMVERFGADVISVPSVREVPRRELAALTVQRLLDGQFDVLVALTGAACEALFEESERSGSLDGVVDSLKEMLLVCRGPKPLGALRRRGLVAGVQTVKPHTSDDLLAALSTVELDGRRVLLLQYGERNQPFAAALTARGADVTDLCLYEWALPEDLRDMTQLIVDTVAGDIDVMLFTSQIQFRHLLDVARAIGRADELLRALRDDVITGSVGPVCTRALRAAGLVPDVIPPSPNGASLVQAIADYVSMFGPDEVG